MASQSEREALAKARPELVTYLETGGQVWDTKEMVHVFEVQGFIGGEVVVTRKKDGQQGTLQFTHSPRWYFKFQHIS